MSISTLFSPPLCSVPSADRHSWLFSGITERMRGWDRHLGRFPHLSAASLRCFPFGVSLAVIPAHFLPPCFIRPPTQHQEEASINTAPVFPFYFSLLFAGTCRLGLCWITVAWRHVFIHGHVSCIILNVVFASLLDSSLAAVCNSSLLLSLRGGSLSSEIVRT